MDKFVYKKPRNLQERVKRSPQKKSLRQSTLHSLAGVVVIEELEQYKTILESDNESVEKKLEVFPLFVCQFTVPCMKVENKMVFINS